MSVAYPPLPPVESGSDSEYGSNLRRKGKILEVQSKRRYNESEKDSSEDSEKEVGEVSRLLKNLIRNNGGKSGENPNKESGKTSDKESGKKSDKDAGEKSNKDSDKKSDKDAGKKSDKDAGKNSDKDSGKKSDNYSGKKSDKDSGKKSGRDSSEESSDDSSEGSGSESESQEDDSDSPAEHRKATRYTKEQRQEVTRVRNCSEKDYYAILRLKENCSQSEVKKAYMKLSLLTHPDKNKFKDAEKAFKMVSRAYQVLGNSSERTKYDRNRKGYKLRGELDPVDLWDEEFADNASGSDSGSESDGDDSDDDEEELKPDSFRLGIYKEATPWVRKLLADPRDSSTKSEIESLNKRIMKQNKKDGHKEGEFLISINVLRAIGIEAGAAMKALEKDSNDKRAKELQEKLEKQFKKTIRTNSYPPEWLECLPWSRKDNGKERRETGSSNERKKATGREGHSSSKQNGGGSDTEMSDVGPSRKRKEKGKGREESSSNERKDKGKGREGSSSKRKDQGSDVDMKDAPTRRAKWEPGETRKGERILGWRPFYKTDRQSHEQVFTGCQLIIEKEGQPNPIALVSGQEVGRRAVDAYRDLPEEEQNDVRFSEKRYTYKDARKFDELLGFACKPFTTKTEGSGSYYPDGYALWSFKDGSQDLVSRECMRRVLGPMDADNEIADFYKYIGETPPWLMEPKLLLKPKKQLTKGSEVKRRSRSRRDAGSDDESDSDSDSDSSGIFVTAKKKGRRHASDGESSDDDSSSSDDSGDGRRWGPMPRTKRNSKTKRTKTVGSNEQIDIFAGIMQKFMKQMAEENRRQAEDMSKKFEEVLRRVPVSGAA